MPLTRMICAAALIVCCFSVSADDYPIRNTVAIDLKLANNYMPAAVPKRAIDDVLRVALVLPTHDPEANAWWVAPVKFEFEGLKWSSAKAVAYDRYTVNFAAPVAAALPRVVGRLFPKTEVVRSDTCEKCDAVIVVDVTSRVFDNDTGEFKGIIVTARVTVIADGSTVASFSAVGSGEVTTSMYWSAHTRARSIGLPALQSLLNDLVRNLLSNPDLEAFIKAKAAERARPSNLQTTATLDDSTAFFPNGRLDAGESAKLQFVVRNQAEGPAFGVRLRILSTAKEIIVPTDIEIGDVLPGANKNATVEIVAGLDVASGVQQLRVETLEKRGYGGRPIVFELASEELKRPVIEVADIGLNDSGGRAKGDGDGQPSNGETVEATLLIRNSGPGDAIGARLTFHATQSIEIVDANLELAAIPANAVREARVLLRIPVTFSGSELALSVRAEESRGAQVAQASKTATWTISLKRPLLEVTYKLFDGNSPDSRGDRDGIVNNGETIDIALVPANRGSLAARKVAIKIASHLPGVTVNPDSFASGELPPSSEGAAHRARIVVPRTTGTDTRFDTLPITVTLSQSDFPPSVQQIALAFNARHPELGAHITTLSPLIEGQSATFALELRNRGALAAENVQVELTSESAGVELFDSTGTPMRKLVMNIGTVPAHGMVPRVPVKAHIRRNLGVLTGALRVVVSQSGFPGLTEQTTLNIQREEVEVVSAVTPMGNEPVRPIVRAGGVPATISFLRDPNGARVNQETIELRFEVQSQAALEVVRLEQNHRAIDPGSGKVTQGQRTYAWRYEPRVRLDYGENEFEVVVVTAEGISARANIIINRERPQGKVWVAAVGISKYANKAINDLSFARDDAVAILSYYRQIGVSEEQLIQLVDEQATLTNIKRTLGTELVSKATNSDDTVILFFAGHGEKESDAGSTDADGYSKYLLPHDADPADLFSSALSMEELTRILQRLLPERVTLIIDSCFSGAAGGRTLYDQNIKPRAPMSDDFIERMASSGRGRVILTASDASEVAQESVELGHGIFTHFLLEGLHGVADADGDDNIDIDEIFKFVSRNVSARTNGGQNPRKKEPNRSGTFVLGRRLTTQK